MSSRENDHAIKDFDGKMRRAEILEWITLGCFATIVTVMYIAMGSSQAMKTAWLEDLLALIPPISFLIARRVERRPPDEDHPYGYRRVMLLSFTTASVAILVFGVLMLYNSVTSLATQHHPSLGHFKFFGDSWQVWSGWIMIASLSYSMVPPLILGRMKLRLAKELHLKTLAADATMNKDDWLTAGAAIVGVLGIGLGYWWADSVAAGVIAINVLKDGFSNIRRSVSDLMDRRPTEVSDQKPLRIEEKVEYAATQFPNIRHAKARLREEGQTITGEVFVVFQDDRESACSLQEVSERVTALDWRLHDLTFAPVELNDKRLSRVPSDTSDSVP